VAIDDLRCPLGILKLYLYVFLLLGVDLLLALPLVGRHAILALMHLFAELFRGLLDLPALRRGMARGVVHRALRATVVAIGRLTGAFVASQTTMAPTLRCSCASGCPGQWLVAASLLLLVVVAAIAIATTWGLGPSAGRGALPLCHLGGWGVPGAAFCSPGALVHQIEECGHILDVVGGELL
jgi:hypothetical protein